MTLTNNNANRPITKNQVTPTLIRRAELGAYSEESGSNAEPSDDPMSNPVVILTVAVAGSVVASTLIVFAIYRVISSRRGRSMVPTASQTTLATASTAQLVTQMHSGMSQETHGVQV
jgi:hypothetical protein